VQFESFYLTSSEFDLIGLIEVEYLLEKHLGILRKVYFNEWELLIIVVPQIDRNQLHFG
jgi:hypothetical protein